MKYIFSCSKTPSVPFIAFGLILSAAIAYGQASNDPTLTFDPQMTGTNGSDGGGMWMTGGATANADFSNGSADVVFPGPTAPVAGSPAGTPNTNTANADFANVGGIVNVVGAVNPNILSLDGSGTYTFNSDSTTPGSINFSFPASNTGYYAGGFMGSGSFLELNSGSVVFNAPINIQADPNQNTSQFSFRTLSSGTETFNGPITLSGLANNSALNVFNDGPGKVVFNSTVTGNSNLLYGVAFGGNAEFNGNVGNGSVAGNGSGTVLIDKASGYGVLAANSGGTVLLNGNFTVGPGVTVQTGGNGTLGSAVTGDSTFDASTSSYNGRQTLTAIAGGRVNFTNTVANSGGVNNQDLVIGGQGVIRFTANQGYASRSGNYSAYPVITQASGSESDVGTEITAGATLIINNPQGGSGTGGGAQQSATSDGNGNNGGPAGVNNVVQLDAGTGSAPGGTFGGTGFTQQQVVAGSSSSAATNAVISPGDMDANKVSSIGTLHFDNGLTAMNGLTVNFQLNGPSTNASDMIEVSNTAENGILANGSTTTPLTLRGAITFNLTNMGGTLDTNNNAVYTLFYGSGAAPWDVGIDPNSAVLTGTTTYNIIAPQGYTVTNGGNPYYIQNANGNELVVGFTPEAVPEPSTWALIGLGGFVWIGLGKFRRLNV